MNISELLHVLTLKEISWNAFNLFLVKKLVIDKKQFRN